MFRNSCKDRLIIAITLCLIILMSSPLYVFAAEEASNGVRTHYTCVAWSADYGLKAHTYYVDAREYFTVNGDNVVGTHRYLVLSEYADMLSGSAGLWYTIDTKYNRDTGTAIQLLKLYPSDYHVGSFILDPAKTYYFFHENEYIFSFYLWDYISKSKVSTYYSLGTDWVPSLFTHNTEFQITY